MATWAEFDQDHAGGVRTAKYELEERKRLAETWSKSI